MNCYVYEISSLHSSQLYCGIGERPGRRLGLHDICGGSNLIESEKLVTCQSEESRVFVTWDEARTHHLFLGILTKYFDNESAASGSIPHLHRGVVRGRYQPSRFVFGGIGPVERCDYL